AMTLNVPTAQPLGTYTGVLRFFNDRGVLWQQRPQNPPGYAYAVSGTGGDNDGFFNGDEAVTAASEGLKVKTRVTEDVVSGRFPTGANGGNPVRDSRSQPAALLYAPNVAGAPPPVPPNPQLPKVLLALTSNAAAG